ncbi:MAG TPA: GNAT family N-acetyltransferase [Acidimicrobiales bacterium]
MTDGNGEAPAVVRPAVSAEFERLRWVERESDKLMAQVGIGPFPDDDHDRLTGAAVVFAAGVPAVGFVSVLLIDDEAHIDQLSVVPERGGHGIGRDLLDEAIRWARRQALSGVTLATFRDVPWNAPFYQRVGFEVVTDLPPGLDAVRSHERDSGLDAMGPRVAMRLAL